MINLLPEFDKKQIRAGRINHLLVRYTIIMAAVLVLMFAEFVLTYFYMQYTKTIAEDAISDNQSKSQEILAKKQEVDTFRGNLSTAKQILDKQVDYSAITLEVASLIPKGVVLEQLTIDPATFGTATTLTAKAIDENAARELKNSLSNSSYFSDVHFNTIARAEGGDSGYPYTATLSLTFRKELLNK